MGGRRFWEQSYCPVCRRPKKWRKVYEKAWYKGDL